MSRGLLEARRGDILRYTDIGRRAFPYARPPYGPGKLQPIGDCWGLGRPALAVLLCCRTYHSPVIYDITINSKTVRI